MLTASLSMLLLLNQVAQLYQKPRSRFKIFLVTAGVHEKYLASSKRIQAFRRPGARNLYTPAL